MANEQKTKIDNLKENIISQIGTIDSLNLEKLYSDGTRVMEWQNMSSPEISMLIDDIKTGLVKLKNNINILNRFPHSIINGISNNLSNFVSQYSGISSIDSSTITNQHHNPLNQLIGAWNTINQYGIYGDLITQVDVDAKSSALDKLNIEYKEAIEDSKTLLENAKAVNLQETSKKLSESFDNRADEIKKDKNDFKEKYLSQMRFTNKITVATIIGFILTFIFNEIPDTISMVIRIGAFPLLALLFYNTQIHLINYKKERKLEEVYRHKSAISSVLPSYHGMIDEPTVQDSLITNVSDMIIEIPEIDGVKNNKKEDIISDFEKLSNVIKNIK